jgi:hypothetical protein
LGIATAVAHTEATPLAFEGQIVVPRLVELFNDLRHDWRDWSQAERATSLVLAVGLTLVVVTWFEGAS